MQNVFHDTYNVFIKNFYNCSLLYPDKPLYAYHRFYLSRYRTDEYRRHGRRSSGSGRIYARRCDRSLTLSCKSILQTHSLVASYDVPRAIRPVIARRFSHSFAHHAYTNRSSNRSRPLETTVTLAYDSLGSSRGLTVAMFVARDGQVQRRER